MCIVHVSGSWILGRAPLLWGQAQHVKEIQHGSVLEGRSSKTVISWPIVLNKFRNTGPWSSTAGNTLLLWVTWAYRGSGHIFEQYPHTTASLSLQSLFQKQDVSGGEKTTLKCPIPVFQQKCCTTLKQLYLCFNCWCYIQDQGNKASCCKELSLVTQWIA